MARGRPTHKPPSPDLQPPSLRERGTRRVPFSPWEKAARRTGRGRGHALLVMAARQRNSWPSTALLTCSRTDPPKTRRSLVSMNLRHSFALLLLCLAGLAPVANAASPNVVISQVYGGGGATTGTPAYTHDYVELFNPTSAAVPIGGWSLQYGSSTGNFGNSGNIFTFPTATSIPAGRYLLVKLGGAGSLGATFTADFTSTGLSMAAGSGKVALATSG